MGRVRPLGSRTQLLDVYLVVVVANVSQRVRVTIAQEKQIMLLGQLPDHLLVNLVVVGWIPQFETMDVAVYV